MVTKTVKQKPDRCQCDPECREPPLKGSPFCERHQRHCSRVSPTTGDELLFDPAIWNQHNGVREAHNCFAYAYGFLDMPNTPKCTNEKCPISFPQPGRAAGYPKWSKVKGKRCPDVIARALGDVPGSKHATFREQCKKGMRKVAFVVDPKEDYHVYRQDKNGYWSHKPGGTDVTSVDASKRPIYDPQLASRTYPDSGLDYRHFCGYMCIPSKKHRLRRSGGKRKICRTRKRSLMK
jgi:hypothetical protein